MHWEKIMRRVTMVLAVAAALSPAVLAFDTAYAQAPTLVAPQTSTISSAVTTCMMGCNSNAAACQTTCVIPGASGASVAAQTATAGTGTGIGTSCQLGCTTTQLTCQTVCSQSSPSR
jgi:hypothetical protein